MSALLFELRLAIRGLFKRPGFSAVVVSTLALAIGATTAIFSVTNTVLFTPLPFEKPEELVLIWNRMTNANRPNAPVSGPDFLDYTNETSMFEDFAGAMAVEATLTGESRPEQIMLGWSTYNLFRILGRKPLMGRDFEPVDGTPIDPRVFMDPNSQLPPGALILTHGMWQRSFGGDPKVLGKTIQIDGQASIIVGVLPADFRIYLPVYAGMPTDIDAWRVFPMDFGTAPRDGEWLTVVSRLKPSVTLEQAQSEMDALSTRFREQFQHHRNVGMEIVVNSMHRDIVEHVRPLLLTLLAAVGFVLLIACANVANLLLVRASGREREIAVRAALGGGQWRIMSQMLVESVVLALIGGALGVFLAWGGVRLLALMRPDDLPRVESVGIDGTVLLFALATSLVSALLFGMVPALRAASPKLADALKDRGSSASGVKGNKIRTMLVVAEVGLTLVLLIGAGLMVRSFQKLQEVEPGFEAQNVLTVKVPLPFFKYRDPNKRADFFDRLVLQLRSLPGVRAAGGGTPIPLGGGDQYWVLPYGREAATDEEWAENRADYRAVLPGYMETMGIELLAGRTFTTADNREDALDVVVIDEKLAETAWPGEDPVDKSMLIMQFDMDTFAIVRAPARVIGVVEHVRSESLTAEGRGSIYFPYRYFPWWPMTVTARTSADPLALVSSVRQEVQAIDPDVPIADIRPMTSFVEEATAQTRFTLTLMGIFGFVALVLAAVGLYGVISYSIRQRTQEIGVRVAFGAESSNIRGLVLRHGLLLALAGIGAGLVVSLAITRMASSLLFGVSPTDAATFVGIPLLLLAVTLLASYVPARRATRIDPVEALRGDHT